MPQENTAGGLISAICSPVEPILERIEALGLKDMGSNAAYNADKQHVVPGDAASIRTLVQSHSEGNVEATVLSVTQV